MAVNITKVGVKLVKEAMHRYEVDKQVCSPEAAAVIANQVLFMNFESQEVVAVLLLNTKNKVNMVTEVSRGSINGSSVHPREVFKAAVLANATRIICVHNHPSGDLTPSYADIQITKRLVKAGEILGISVLDHVIVGGENEHAYYSMRECNPGAFEHSEEEDFAC